jgi:predicted nuclease with TOPRIM domain
MSRGLEEMSETDINIRDFIRRGETSFQRIEDALKTSQADLNQKFNSFQSEVKSEMSEMKGDIKLLNERLGSGKDSVARVENEFNKMEREVCELRQHTQGLSGSVVELRTQMKIASAVGGGLLVAVIALVFKVFSGA